MTGISGKVLHGKSCYGHLGGTLGNRLFERLVELKWFTRAEGTSTVYLLTDKGLAEMEKLGVNVLDLRPCKPSRGSKQNEEEI